MAHTFRLFPAGMAWAATAGRSWASWAGFVAAAAGAGAVMANVPLVAWSHLAEPAGFSMPREAPSAAEPALLADDGQGAAQARVRPRCEGCGIVEAIRHFAPAAGVPAGYEFTVRMRDGSTRVSSDADAARWRIGDAILLIGGARRSVQ